MADCHTESLNRTESGIFLSVPQRGSIPPSQAFPERYIFCSNQESGIKIPQEPADKTVQELSESQPKESSYGYQAKHWWAQHKKHALERAVGEHRLGAIPDHCRCHISRA